MPDNVNANTYRTTPGLLLRSVGVATRYVFSAGLIVLGAAGVRHGVTFLGASDIVVGAACLLYASDSARKLVKYADRPKYPAHAVE